MKITPVAVSTTTPQTTTPASSRDRAVALLNSQMKANAQPEAVANPNSVSPEEMSAVTTGQDNTIDKTTSPESPKEETKVDAPKEDPLSTQYANLARKEKQLRARAIQQDQALKAKEAAIAAKEAELKAKETEYSTKYISKDKLSQDTLNALAEAGLTYDQITELMLTQQDPGKLERVQSERRLEAKIKELEDKQLKIQQQTENQQTEAYKQAINQIRSDTRQLVSSNPEFETIKETNSIDDVVELIERTFKKDGILLTVDDAAKQVEDYLVEEAFKLTKLKKIQQRLAPPPKPEEPKLEPQQKPQTMKTLTNAVASTGKLSSRDRAIAAFKGQLGK